ncbi:MAG TPA: hypothetical protein VMZ74_09945 [Ramlibacter sp.]|nr:hypothetical protein [Ramlibacter sp.]
MDVRVPAGCIVSAVGNFSRALMPEWEFRREVDARTGYNELVASVKKDISQ